MQLHLDERIRELNRQSEMRIEIRALALSLGWVCLAPGHDDLDDFCMEIFGLPMILCGTADLEWLLAKFRDMAK